MAAKIFEYNATNEQKVCRQLWFHCPGCKHAHAFTIGDGLGPRWSWNGSVELPTFQPSLLCNKDYPESRCHSFVTDGKIQFLSDCFHELKGQTVELPDWEPWEPNA